MGRSSMCPITISIQIEIKSFLRESKFLKEAWGKGDGIFKNLIVWHTQYLQRYSKNLYRKNVK